MERRKRKKRGNFNCAVKLTPHHYLLSLFLCQVSIFFSPFGAVSLSTLTAKQPASMATEELNKPPSLPSYPQVKKLPHPPLHPFFYLFAFLLIFPQLSVASCKPSFSSLHTTCYKVSSFLGKNIVLFLYFTFWFYVNWCQKFIDFCSLLCWRMIRIFVLVKKTLFFQYVWSPQVFFFFGIFYAPVIIYFPGEAYLYTNSTHSFHFYFILIFF